MGEGSACATSGPSGRWLFRRIPREMCVSETRDVFLFRALVEGKRWVILMRGGCVCLAGREGLRRMMSLKYGQGVDMECYVLVEVTTGV